MRYEIVVSPEAAEDLNQLEAHARAKIKDLMEVHLRHEPTKTSRSRIKKLKGLKHPQFRLRVDDARVFYDVEGDHVRILAIIRKSQVTAWLERAGEEI